MKPIVALFLALLAGLATFAVAAPPDWSGTWTNAKGSVRIKAARCGAGMCGRVVWANAEAQEKAAAGGTERLVGTELFRDFRRDADGLWYGEVYVPDLAQSVSGTIEQQGPNRLVGNGCLFAGFGCKTQVWTRVGK